MSFLERRTSRASHSEKYPTSEVLLMSHLRAQVQTGTYMVRDVAVRSRMATRTSGDRGASRDRPPGPSPCRPL